LFFVFKPLKEKEKFMKLNLFTMVGGISRQSINRQLFAQIKDHSALEFDLFPIETLPFFSQDIETSPPFAVEDMKKRVQAADGVLVITPEYNRSYPGVLKNALDWGSRPAGSSVWAGKPAAVMGASMGTMGTFGAQQHLRNVMSFLNMPLLSQPEVYLNFTLAAENGILNPSSRQFVEKFLQAFTEWIRQLKK
jgi:chromate reductase